MLRGRSSSNRGSRGATASSRGSSTSRGRGRGASSSSSIASGTNPSDPFEKDRSENAAKREQRGQENETINGHSGRGTSRGRSTNKSVRFASPPEQQLKQNAASEPSPFSKPVFGSSSTSIPNSQKPFNPFVQTSSPFGTETVNITTKGTNLNPFGVLDQTIIPSSNPFNASGTANNTTPNPFVSSTSTDVPVPNPFGTPSATIGRQPATIFGTSSNLGASSRQSNPLGGTLQTDFKTPNPFTRTSTTVGTQVPSIFGGSSPLNSDKKQMNHYTFGGTSSIQNPSVSGTPLGSITTNAFQNGPSTHRNGTAASSFGGASAVLVSGEKSPFAVLKEPSKDSKNKLAIEIENLLHKNRIKPPPWPTQSPGDPNQKGIMEGFWQSYKAYRAKARECLIRNSYIDDPEKPKKLSEAIDFKGTCEEMCPEFEKITRIVEHDVKDAEKELSRDNKNYWPSPRKMIKKLARSAAGQDAPLPEDVRSPAALRRTLDYLIDTILGENDLVKSHGFLWDRTRAIRRDFVFQQAAMNSEELSDQIYCLELITRFHVTALHQMSHNDVVAEDFSEQQELEQLGKALLSLIHAYEDNAAQGKYCENEPEFRAYYVLFNSHNTSILEAVQDWGYRFWGGSGEIRTAVSLVETLQNIWDTQGPLKPESAADIAQNAFHRFFSIVQNSKVSYTMACFAEIHFNKVRKAALKTILAAYRKQRDQTRDWSLDKLNDYLHFDEEEEIITFGEAYGLNFETFDGQDYLSFNSDDSMTDPFPPLKQTHSNNIVERKRGHYTLPEVIHHTVYEEPAQMENNQSLFVPLSPSEVERNKPVMVRSPISDTSSDTSEKPQNESGSLPSANGWTAFEQKGKESMSSTTSNVQIIQPKPSFISQNPSQKHKSGEVASLSASEFKGESATNTAFISVFDKQNTPKAGIFNFLNNSISNPHDAPPNTSRFPTTQSTSISTSKSSEFASSTPSAADPPALKFTGPSAPVQLVSSAFPPTATVDSAAPATTAKIPVSKRAQSETEQKPLAVTRSDLILEKSKGLDISRENLMDSTPVVAEKSTEPKMLIFAKWVAAGNGGIIDQFIEFTVNNIVRQTVEDYLTAEKKRREEEEDKMSREEAARYRIKFLATKYCHKWQYLAHRMWMRRKGRMARQARREMAEKSARTSGTLEGKDVVKEFRASRENSKNRGLERMLAVTSVLNGVHDIENGIGSSVRTSDNDSSPRALKKARKSQRSAQMTSDQASMTSGSSHDRSNDVLRKSLLSDSAYLQGGSRIHLMSNYSPKSVSYHQQSGVQTDYFRLKARGIVTLPNGTPLANTAAVRLPQRERLYDDLSKLTAPKQPSSSPIRSIPSRFVGRPSSKANIERDVEKESLKNKVITSTADDVEKGDQGKKRILDDDDEELLAKAKRIREQMDEDIEWFRIEMQKSFSRSAS